MQKSVNSVYHADVQHTQVGRPQKATHAVIVRAAWDLFEEVGFDAANMTAIAERAGVSRRTLFNHFPHKAALLFNKNPFMEAFKAELERQPKDASLYDILTKTFWVVAPIAVEFEARMAPGPGVNAARVRDDVVAYWKQEWAREFEALVLEVFGSDQHIKAGFVGAIAAHLWAEFIAIRMHAAMPADQAMAIVLNELAETLGLERS